MKSVSTVLLTAFAALAAFAASERSARAFPEMVRHNYPNCISCHVSPNGGGVLTQYGRQLSGELLSTWSKGENEPKFAYGLVNTPDWLLPGGDYRSVYTYLDSPTLRQGKYIFMQADLEAAVQFKQWTADATIGYRDNVDPNASSLDHFFSRRHYLNYRPTDELSFRFGKYRFEYGINVPDHIIQTKRGLNWDEGTETYNVEAAWIGDKFNAFVTGVFGRFDLPNSDVETGVALSGSAAIADHYKVGASYFHGSSTSQSRDVFGPWGILGFTPRFFLLSEWDFQGASPVGLNSRTWGLFQYQRLDYELIQGLHFFVMEDLGRADFSDPRSLQNSYGIGTQFFPRPHFEFQLVWTKQRIAAVSNDYNDFAYLMWHLYL